MSFANRLDERFESNCHNRNFLIILESLRPTLWLLKDVHRRVDKVFCWASSHLCTVGSSRNLKFNQKSCHFNPRHPNRSASFFCPKIHKKMYCDSLAWLRDIFFSYRACKNSFLLEKISRVDVATFIELEFHKQGGHYHHSRTFLLTQKIEKRNCKCECLIETSINSFTPLTHTCRLRFDSNCVNSTA